MTDTKFWPCEEIKQTSNGEWRFTSSSGSTALLPEYYLFCEHCGAKRPEEPKTPVDELATIIRNVSDRTTMDLTYIPEAQAAINFFISKMPKVIEHTGEKQMFSEEFLLGIFSYRTELLKALGREE